MKGHTNKHPKFLKKFWGYCPNELPLCSGSKPFPEPLMPQQSLSAILLTKKLSFSLSQQRIFC